jgi:hypothetical protein
VTCNRQRPLGSHFALKVKTVVGSETSVMIPVSMQQKEDHIRMGLTWKPLHVICKTAKCGKTVFMICC